MLGVLYDIAKLLALKVLVLVDALRRWARPIEGKVLRFGAGEQVPGARRTLCLFAHFDRDGVIDDYVVQYLRSLHELDCETVVVSTAEGLDEEDIGRILPYCMKFIVKENIGYDFASWRTGLQAVGDISGYERVIVANDSVYGPLQDLKVVFDEMQGRNVDFWGITDSLKYGRHLQSYFLVFGKAVLSSPAFLEFWHDLPDYRHKYAVIIQGEVGLTRKLAAAGFAFAAYCPIEAVQERQESEAETLASKFRDPRISPTHRAWRGLLREGSPFLKIQLLRDNPMRVPGLDNWEAVLGDVSGYDPGIIKEHLARMRRR
ncbi:MAG: hypothetical protein JSV19_04700 [Phycisphaerales bacterium]|nr:MAG: hypothetical protein JSV19_04700 [Phycisphaerales bacterium]